MLGNRVDEDDREVGIGNKVILNVGGIRHETYVSTLRNIPDTRLHSLTSIGNPTQLPEFDPSSGEFFFDRHPIVFAQILNYYRTGKLHCPNDVCGPLFEEELAFWGLEDASIETCCWMNYKKHNEAQANLSSFDKVVEEGINEPDYNFHDEETGTQTRDCRQLLRKFQSKIWITLEEPSSSVKAKIIAMATMVLIIASVIVTCLETTEYFSQSQSIQYRVINILEIVCIVWFTIEFILRAMVCPSKRKFVKQIMNWLDLASIVPFYVQFFLTSSEDMNSIVAIRIIRLIRVFRVFKLSRHSYSLQILGHTLRSSLSELFLLGFFVSIGVVVFSSLMYYAESDTKNTKFSSIPAGFWWAVITMTTVGYGDFVPTNLFGRLVGTCCAICGVLTIALPIPVIVSNFSLYYSHAKARQKSLKKKRPLVIGAANALKVIEPFVGPRAANLRPRDFQEISFGGDSNPGSRAWPTIALQMAGISFESSEPSPSTLRRGLPQSEVKNQGSSYGATTEDSATPQQRKHDLSTDYDDVPKDSDEARHETNHTQTGDENMDCQEAYDNEGAEAASQVDYNEDNVQQSNVPIIEIERKCSSSQGSSSNTDEFQYSEGNIPTRGKSKRKKTVRKRSKKKQRKARVSINESSQSEIIPTALPNRTPPGRMGRRSSVFVVGFIGKKWMAKAAKSRNNLFESGTSIELKSRIHDKNESNYSLGVSPKLSPRHCYPYDATSIATSTTDIWTPTLSASPSSPHFHRKIAPEFKQAETLYARRSSCPCPGTNRFEASPKLDVKTTLLKGWKSEGGHVNKMLDNTEEATTKRLEEANSTPDKAVNETGLQFGSRLSNNERLKKELSFSSVGSDSSQRGLDRGSPLVRQSAIFSINKDVSDSEEDERGDKKQGSTTVFIKNGNSDTNMNGKYGKWPMPQKLPDEKLEKTEIKDVHVSSADEKTSKRTERRNLPSLTNEFPVSNQTTSAYIDTSRVNSNQETAQDKDSAFPSVSSTEKESVVQNFGENLPSNMSQGCNSTYVQIEDYYTSNQRNSLVIDCNPVTTQNNQVLENVTTIGEGPQESRRISLPNSSSGGSSGHNVHEEPVYNHVPLTRLKYSPEARRIPFGSTSKYAQKNAISKNDSGISSVESRTSFGATFSLEDKDGQRGTLNPIREVETNDCHNTDCIIQLPFFDSRQFEKSTNFNVVIKGETVV